MSKVKEIEQGHSCDGQVVKRDTHELAPDGPSTIVTTGGRFLDSLKRNNRQIRDDRANSITDDVQLVFRRFVEDLSVKIKRLKRDRDNMLDLSPDTAQSLVLAINFDATQFVQKDLAIGVEIRESEIKLKIAQDRYFLLFGEEI